MFLGKSVTFSRSGNQLSGFSRKVGALHFSVTGYTAVRVLGSGVDVSQALQDGYNLVSFTSAQLSNLTLTFTGTGSVDWTTLACYENYIHLWDESKRERPRQRVLSSSPSGGVADSNRRVWWSIGLEWRYLPWTAVDALEEIFDNATDVSNADPTMILIPDGYEAESYTVVITSNFDFYQSVDDNFQGGASGALVFDTI